VMQPYVAVNYQGGSSQAGSYQSGMVQAPLSQTSAVSPVMATPPKPPTGETVVNDYFTALRAGRFSVPNCRQTAARLFTADAVIDYRGATDVDVFKMYPPGIDGVCEHFANTQSYGFHGLKHGMYAKADRIVHVLSYIPGFVGRKAKKASGRISQFNVIRFDATKTKIAGFDALFDKPSLFDELRYEGKQPPLKTPQMDVVVGAFRAFTAGRFKKKKTCSVTAASYYASDAVIDTRGEEKDDFMKKYPPGIDGVCDYYKQSADFGMHHMNASVYARGEDVVLVLNYVPDPFPGLPGKPEPVIELNLHFLNADKTKIAGVDMFFDGTVELEKEPEADEHDPFGSMATFNHQASIPLASMPVTPQAPMTSFSAPGFQPPMQPYAPAASTLPAAPTQQVMQPPVQQ